MNKDISREKLYNDSKNLSSILKKFDPNIIDEISGIADGSGIELEKCILYQMLPYVLRVTTLEKESCTAAYISNKVTNTGKPLIFKNKDYNYIFKDLQLIHHITPDDGLQHIAIGIVGWVGCDIGLNNKGMTSLLTWCDTKCTGEGLQSHIINRYILQKFKTVSDAVSFLKEINRTGKSNFLISDINGNAVVFENGHEMFDVRHLNKDDFLVCTNHFVSNKMKVCTPNLSDGYGIHKLASTHSRFDRMTSLLYLKRGEISDEYLMSISKDHLGEKSYYSICSHGEIIGTISTIIVSPQDKKITFHLGVPCEGGEWFEYFLE